MGVGEHRIHMDVFLIKKGARCVSAVTWIIPDHNNCNQNCIIYIWAPDGMTPDARCNTDGML